jgi:hypothetical protein
MGRFSINTTLYSLLKGLRLMRLLKGLRLMRNAFIQCCAMGFFSWVSPLGSRRPLGSGPLGSRRPLGSGPLGSRRPLGSGPLGSRRPLGSGPLGSGPLGSRRPFGYLISLGNLGFFVLAVTLASAPTFAQIVEIEPSAQTQSEQKKMPVLFPSHPKSSKTLSPINPTNSANLEIPKNPFSPRSPNFIFKSSPTKSSPGPRPYKCPKGVVGVRISDTFVVKLAEIQNMTGHETDNQKYRLRLQLCSHNPTVLKDAKCVTVGSSKVFGLTQKEPLIQKPIAVIEGWDLHDEAIAHFSCADSMVLMAQLYRRHVLSKNEYIEAIEVKSYSLQGFESLVSPLPVIRAYRLGFQSPIEGFRSH